MKFDTFFLYNRKSHTLIKYLIHLQCFWLCLVYVLRFLFCFHSILKFATMSDFLEVDFALQFSLLWKLFIPGYVSVRLNYFLQIDLLKQKHNFFHYFLNFFSFSNADRKSIFKKKRHKDEKNVKKRTHLVVFICISGLLVCIEYM